MLRVTRVLNERETEHLNASGITILNIVNLNLKNNITKKIY